MNIKNYIAISLSAILFWSCEKIIEFKGEETEPYLVLTSTPESDSIFTAYLSKSIFTYSPDVNDSTKFYVKDGKVNLFVNGEDKGELQHAKNGEYQHPSYRSKIGDKIELRAFYSGFPELYSSSSQPQRTNIISCDTTVVKDEQGNYNVAINIAFDTSVDVAYYRLRIALVASILDLTLGKTTVIREAWKSSDPIFSAGPLSGGNSYKIFPRDNLTTGTYSINATMNLFTLEPSITAEAYIEVDLQSISKELYEYYLSLNKYGTLLGSMTAEPVKVYSNIQNGLGILGGYTTNVQKISLLSHPLPPPFREF